MRRGGEENKERKTGSGRARKLIKKEKVEKREQAKENRKRMKGN